MLFKNIVLLVLCTSATFLLSTSLLAQNNADNQFRIIPYQQTADTLRVSDKFVSESQDIAYNPMNLLNLNDEFIIVKDMRPNNFFTTIKWSDSGSFEVLYTWGRESRGPESDEFATFPFHSYSSDSTLITAEPMIGVLRHIEISESEPILLKRLQVSINNSLGSLNRPIPVSDSLLFVINDMFIEMDHNLDSESHEWAAVNPQTGELLFRFGKYPGDGYKNKDMFGWDFYTLGGISNPRNNRFASFYIGQNAFKIFDHHGTELHAVKVDDELTNPQTLFNSITEKSIRTPNWADDEFIFTINYQHELPWLEVWTWDGELHFAAPFDLPVYRVTVSRKHRKMIGVSSEFENKLLIWDLDNILPR